MIIINDKEISSIKYREGDIKAVYYGSEKLYPAEAKRSYEYKATFSELFDLIIGPTQFVSMQLPSGGKDLKSGLSSSASGDGTKYVLSLPYQNHSSNDRWPMYTQSEYSAYGYNIKV